MVLVERPVSSAMSAIPPPAFFAARTASMSFRRLRSYCFAAVWSWRRSGCGVNLWGRGISSS